MTSTSKELIELTTISKDYDKILSNLSSSRWILISILIILILFFVLTIGFVYYPVYVIEKQVTTIHQESQEALAILQNGSASVEMTLQKLNAAAIAGIKTEDTIIGFIKAACTVPPFKFFPYCQEITG